MRSMFYSVNNCFKYKRKPWNLIFIDVRWIANVDAQELNGCLTAASRDRAGFASPVFVDKLIHLTQLQWKVIYALLLLLELIEERKLFGAPTM